MVSPAPVYGSMEMNETPKIVAQNSWSSKVEAYFKIKERNTTINTEIWAGFINFVANSYLLALVPQMCMRGGVPKDVSITGFILATFFSSFLVGVTSNLPIAAGPGLGCATYFAYGLAKVNTGDRGVTLAVTKYCLTACFLSSCLMFLLAVCGLPMRLFTVVPKSVKEAMPVGLGLLLALCEFQQMQLVVNDPSTGVTMGSLSNSTTCMGVFGVFFMAFLEWKHFKASFLIPILTVTGIAWVASMSPLPSNILSTPSVPWSSDLLKDDGSTSGTFVDLSLLTWGVLSPILAIYIICLFDIAGIMYSVCRIAGLVVDGSVVGAYWVFLSCGVGSVVSAIFGCTPCIVFGEAFAGVLVGGRTGLTAVSMAFMFLLTLPLAPLVSAIPLFATAPVLVILGVTLTGLLRHLEWDNINESFPAFCTIALMPFLYSIDHAIMAGLVAHFAFVLADCLYSPREKGTAAWKWLCQCIRSPKTGPRDRRFSVYDDLISPAQMARKNSFHGTPLSLNYTTP